MRWLLLHLSFYVPLIYIHAQVPALAWEARLDTGYMLLEEENYDSILDKCQNWLAEARTPKSVKASILTLEGHAWKAKKQPTTAIQYHKKALEIRNQVFGKSSEEAANCHQNIANCYYDLGDYDQATNFYHKNLDIRRHILPANGPQLVVPLMNLGDALFQQGKINEAFKFFQEGLVIQAQSGGYHEEIAAILQSDLANCLFENGLYQQALDSLQASWATLQQLPHAQPLEKGYCLQRTGNCLLQMGDAETARQFYLNALHYMDGSPFDKATTLYGLAALSRYRKDYESALAYLSDAASTCAIDLPSGHSLRRLNGAIWLQFGSCYLEMEQMGGAVFYIEKAAETFRTTPNSEKQAIAALLKMGMCLEVKKDFSTARERYQEALNMARQLSDPEKYFAAHYRLGELDFQQGNLADAMIHFREARMACGTEDSRLYEQIQAISATAKTAKEMIGTQLEYQKGWTVALEMAKEGIVLLDRLKGKLLDEHSDIDVQEDFYQLYNLAIEATIALNQPSYAEKAFALAEQYRGNLFKKLARKTYTGIGPEKEILAAFRRVEQKLAEANKKRFDLSGNTHYYLKPDETSQLDSLIQALTSEKTTLQKRLEKTVPGYWELWQNNVSISPYDISQLLRPGQTFLEYQWGEEKLFVFLISRDTFFVKTLQLRPSLQQDILSFYNLCNKNPEWLPENRQQDLPLLGYKLYQQLLDPLSEWLGPELIIVPDSWLCYLPFEALLDRPHVPGQSFWEFQYLAYGKSFGYTYSGALFQQLKNAKAGDSQKTLLAFAPVFDGSSPVLKPLFHNAKEAATAVEVFGGKSLDGPGATKDNALKLAAAYRMLFFATHGVLDDRNAAWSYLAFSTMGEVQEADLLHAWEVYGLNLHADLVILSACQTANGRMYRGEGLMSMARAFQFAGAKSVAAALWNVDDKQTPELMEVFFKLMAKGSPKTVALTDAKRHYLKNAPRLKTHPFFWSGFVIIGDGGAVNTSGQWGWIAYTAAASIVVLVAFYFLRKYGIISRHKKR